MVINKLENKNDSIVIKIFIAVLFIVILATDTFALTIEEPRGTGAMVDGEVIINTPKGGDLNVRTFSYRTYVYVVMANSEIIKIIK